MKFKNWCKIILIFHAQGLVAEGFNHDLIQGLHEDKLRPQLKQLSSNQLTSISLDFNELLDQSDQPIETDRSMRIDSIGRQLFAQGQITAPKWQNTVKKNIPNLWRVVIPADWPVEEVPILVEWNKTNTIAELVPWVQRKQQMKNGSTIIEGGVTVIIDPNQITQSGLTDLGIRIDLKPF